MQVSQEAPLIDCVRCLIGERAAGMEQEIGSLRAGAWNAEAPYAGG
jgi:hypothetical protein